MSLKESYIKSGIDDHFLMPYLI